MHNIHLHVFPISRSAMYESSLRPTFRNYLLQQDKSAEKKSYKNNNKSLYCSC